MKVKMLLWIGIFSGAVSACSDEKVDFSAQVKPILNKRCISCHGGVKKNAGFSVLFRHEAIDTTESGKPSIVPGHPELSEVIRRISSKDPEFRMPYKEEPLTNEEIDILTRWIRQGAEWGEHWAYTSPKTIEVPKSNKLLSSFGSSTDEGFVKNDIDYFILDRLEKEGLTPSPRASKEIIVRRVYLDLIGLPPTPEQAKAFLDDNRDDAYEVLVDGLLASLHFGEKWASWWLDLARYADTKGYEKDAGRNIWRYRDYVINAFNKDLPYDQFTIEQLAGDLLPDPTDDQLIATAFHRNTMSNDEGGTENEEFRVAATIDRVNTTWEVWQSTTFGCIQCHSHPYDPFVHEDYYRSLAFFNNTRDEDTAGDHPKLLTYTAEDEKKLETIRTWVLANSTSEREKEVTLFLKTQEPKYHPHDFDQFINGGLIDTKLLGTRPKGSARIKQINLYQKNFLIIRYYADHSGGTLKIRQDNLNGPVIASVNLPKTQGTFTYRIPLKHTGGKHDLFFQFDNQRIEAHKHVCVIEWFALLEELPGSNKPGYEQISKEFITLLNTPAEGTPVIIENKAGQKRLTYVFERGNWMVKGESVDPEVPRSLNTSARNVAADRLGFAQWLMSHDNPLASRTITNRIWEQVFGSGIVETLEDFGSQGATPTHPELLDWLALRMMNDHRWSIKKLLKDMVMSASYRQSSYTTDEVLEKDQANQWLARAPRVRLSAEQIRDQALAISGLLSKKMYGKSVMPHQPEGIWNSVYSGEYWKQSEGEDQHRRGVYTFIKRTSPYPSVMMFDGSSREVCVSRRIRTNTPLQALVTLNDPVFVEASRYLAKRMMADEPTPENAIRTGYQLLTLKEIPGQKLTILHNLYRDAVTDFQTDTAAVRAMTKEKEGTYQHAAMTVVANALLNLDEVITKE